MPVNNPWLSSFQRSFGDIKNQIVSVLRTKVPEITNFSEGNIFIRLISIQSAIAEVLHYYVDNIARETFFITARKYSSLIKHAKMVDYHVNSANPASVDIMLTLSTGKVITVDISIPAGTIFSSREALEFVTSKPYIWRKGTYSITISALQATEVSNVTFGLIPDEDTIVTLGNLGTGNFYSEGSMSLVTTVDGVSTNWSLVTTLAYSTNKDHHFKVELDSEQQPVVIFGNGINGAKPTIGSLVTGGYRVTRGIEGNIAPGDMVSVPTNINTQVPDIICTNREKASGGTNYEDFDSLKAHVPLHIRTLGVAITQQDYSSVAMLVPGVDKAFTVQECGKSIKVYITPDGGGIATEELRNLVQYHMIKKKVLGTTIDVLPARESLIYLQATITGRPSFKSLDISNQVIDHLISTHDYNKSGIGKSTRLSELYAEVEGLSMVDYLIITNLYLKPLPIAYSGAVELNFDIDIVSILLDVSYLIRYDEPHSRFELISLQGSPTGMFITYNGANSEWTNIALANNDWTIKPLPSSGGAYINGNIWRIDLIRNNIDQVSPVLSIPLFKDKAQFKLEIIETT